MDQFARIVLGYHGCNTPESVEFARRLFDGTASVAEWQPSDNPYDWLGHEYTFGSMVRSAPASGPVTAAASLAPSFSLAAAST